MRLNTINSTSKIVIVIGSGWSGSSAVFDYLKTRREVCDPFQGEELRIIQDTFGLEYLHNAICENFSPSNADYAIEMFKKTWTKVGKLQRIKNAITNRDRAFIKSTEIKNYVNQITALTYSGSNSTRLRQKNYLKNLFSTFLRKYFDIKKRHLKIECLHLPVEPDQFLTITKLWIDNLIKDRVQNSLNEVIALEQAGNFWNPASCLKFFGENSRVVLVHRNPYDTFAEIKQDGHPYPDKVQDYVLWYNNVMSRVNINNSLSNKILHINFEDFINEFSIVKGKLDKFIGIPNETKTNFDAEKSTINIGKYKKFLSAKEIEYMKKNLSNVDFN